MTSVNISFLGVFGGPKSVDLVVGLGGDLVEAIQTVYDETFNSKHLQESGGSLIIILCIDKGLGRGEPGCVRCDTDCRKWRSIDDLLGASGILEDCLPVQGLRYRIGVPQVYCVTRFGHTLLEDRQTRLATGLT
jgi:hypothetical protein